MCENKFNEKIDYAIALVDKIEYFPLRKSQNSSFVYSFPDGTDVASFVKVQIGKQRSGLLTDAESAKLNTLLEKKKDCRDIKLNVGLNEIADIVSPLGYIPSELKFSNGRSVYSFLRTYKRKMLNHELSPTDMEVLSYFLDYYNKFNVRLRENAAVAIDMKGLPIVDKYSSNSEYIRKFSDDMRENNFNERIDYAIALVDKIEYFPLPKPQNSSFAHSFPDGTDIGSFISVQIGKQRSDLLTDAESAKLNTLLEKKKDCRDIKLNVGLNEIADIVSPLGYIPSDLRFSNGRSVYSFLRTYKRKMLNHELSPTDMEVLSYFLDYYNKLNVRLREIDEVASDMERFPIADRDSSNPKYIRKFSDGSDMGSYIERLIVKLRKNKLSIEEKNKVISLFDKYSSPKQLTKNKSN